MQEGRGGVAMCVSFHKNRRFLKRTLGRCVLGLLFFTGLVLTGADGPTFPYHNCAGLFLLALFGILGHRYLPGPKQAPPPDEKALKDLEDFLEAERAHKFNMMAIANAQGLSFHDYKQRWGSAVPPNASRLTPYGG